MKYYKITFKHVGRTDERRTFKGACELADLNYNSMKNRRSRTKETDIETDLVKIEQKIMEK